MCGRIALGTGDGWAAAQILGAIRPAGGRALTVDDVETLRTIQATRGQLGSKRFLVAWNLGVKMSSADSTALCRAVLDAAAAAGEPVGAPAHQRATHLTAREREVVVLIGRGLKDREIASTLVMGRATASWHVRNVLSKLGLSRAQVGVWALQRGLLHSQTP
jgi:DNA-binding NarL/FixJ family response regulator